MPEVRGAFVALDMSAQFDCGLGLAFNTLLCGRNS